MPCSAEWLAIFKSFNLAVIPYILLLIINAYNVDIFEVNPSNFDVLAAMVALRSTAVNYSDVGEKPYDLVYAGLWKACIVKDAKERCEDLLIGQGRFLHLLTLSPLDGPYGSMTNTGKDDFSGVKYQIL